MFRKPNIWGSLIGVTAVTLILPATLGSMANQAASPAKVTVTPKATTVCSTLTAPLYNTLNRGDGSQLLTPWENEATNAVRKYNYSSSIASPFRASLKTHSGLTPVWRLYRNKTGDFLYTASPTEVKSARKIGYTGGTAPAFYAVKSNGSCGTPIYRFYRKGIHRLTLASGAKKLRAAGWKQEEVAWRAALPASAPTPPTPPLPPKPPVAPPSAKPAALTQPLFDSPRMRGEWFSYLAAPAGSTEQKLMWQLVASQTGIWIGGASTDISLVTQVEDAATALHQTPTFVLYGIPNRDGGGYSAGGFPTEASYYAWVDSIHKILAGKSAIVIIEPDAIGYSGLPKSEQPERIRELQYDLKEFATATNPTIAAYLHAGSRGINPTDMAAALKLVGISQIRGIALNVSSYDSIANEVTYGQALDSALGTPTPFVIDTGRDGMGRVGNEGWCNPADQAPGKRPTVNTGIANLDALLWIHGEGGSDGTCGKGDAPAGSWSLPLAEKYTQVGIDKGTFSVMPVGTYAKSN